jgi:ubiquinone/menaquinone biosynthesis C-methylase UbiE
MAHLDVQKTAWEQYDWSAMGEEWSSEWGNSTVQWIHTILSRIHCLLPAESILEIAPGYGRWTRFLIDRCSKYVGIDISETCIDACRERFKNARHARFAVNDGKSLSTVDDNSIDFVFSFDSMVHCETDVLQSYLSELAKKLKVGGKGFIHHSNMGEYLVNGELTVPNKHWRGKSMTLSHFREFCANSGLKCVSQEKVTWGQVEFNDGFSFFARLDTSDPNFSTPTLVVENSNFLIEITNAKTIYRLYAENAGAEK